MSAQASGRHRLYCSKGSGSMLVEAAFERAGVPVEFVDLAWEDVGWNSRVLAPLNPLGQIPTLVLPDGTVMTESAAMILYLAERAPDAGLAPAIGHPSRPAFL